MTDVTGPTNQSRALPLISRQSPCLVRPSVFLARSARLARYAVAQRVQNSRVWPHNGLKTRPTYAQTKFRANPAKIAYTPRNHAQGLALSLRPSASRQPRRRVERPLSSRQRRRPDQLGRRGLDADGHRTDPAHNPWSVALLRRHGPFQ